MSKGKPKKGMGGKPSGPRPPITPSRPQEKGKETDSTRVPLWDGGPRY